MTNLTNAKWLPIETAPRDGTRILGWCVHNADPYYLDEGQRLTTYGAHCEGVSRVLDGPHVIEWGGEINETEFGATVARIPDWWFLNSSEFEVVANPTHWMPIPECPYKEVKVDD